MLIDLTSGPASPDFQVITSIVGFVVSWFVGLVGQFRCFSEVMATKTLIKGDRFMISPFSCLSLTLLDKGSASEAPLEASPARL